MATIKAMIAEMLHKSNRSSDDDTVRGKVSQQLKEICQLLPNETREGQEFANVMFSFQSEWHTKAVNALLEKAMDERDDLGDEKYGHLRQKIVEVITKALQTLT